MGKHLIRASGISETLQKSYHDRDASSSVITNRKAELVLRRHLLDGLHDGDGLSGARRSENDVWNSGNATGNDFFDLKYRKKVATKSCRTSVIRSKVKPPCFQSLE